MASELSLIVLESCKSQVIDIMEPTQKDHWWTSKLVAQVNKCL